MTAQSVGCFYLLDMFTLLLLLLCLFVDCISVSKTLYLLAFYKHWNYIIYADDP